PTQPGSTACRLAGWSPAVGHRPARSGRPAPGRGQSRQASAGRPAPLVETVKDRLMSMRKPGFLFAVGALALGFVVVILGAYTRLVQDRKSVVEATWIHTRG